MNQHMNKTISHRQLSGERALFGEKNAVIYDTLFHDGESPLKHSENIRLDSCTFDWKYPLWYSKHIALHNCKLTQTARAGIWYTNKVHMENTAIEAPKTFRRCDDVTLDSVTLPNAAETLWQCSNVTLCNVGAKGDYFAMNSRDMRITRLELDGNYPFDGAENIEIHDSRLLSKDAFWNADNITVYDSYISGEYLGWNSKNLTFINCTIESLQGMCYIDNLRLINCKLVNTTLAFEYSSVEAEICSGIDSVLNPKSGSITADFIGTLILEKDKIDPLKTIIKVREYEV